MNITLRLEEINDHRAVEELNREAFWGRNNPGCEEHYLAHQLRKSPGFIPELDFVAEVDGQIVGSVLFSLGAVVSPSGQETQVLNFGPLAILPSYQSKGVGKVLMKHALAKAQELGYKAVVFFGHPDYYPRLGFKRGSDYGITAGDGASFDALMAMELVPGALDGISGCYQEDAACQLDPESTEAFDKTFPPKDKVNLTPLSVLLDRLQPVAIQSLQSLGLVHLCSLQGKSERETRALPGIDDEAIGVIKQVMREHGYRWGV